MMLQTVLELPEYLQAGLSAGMYERIGGIIRESNSKQIVAWLRDGSQLAQPGPNAFGPFAQTISTFSPTGLLINLALTSATFAAMLQRLNQLSQQTGRLLQEHRDAVVTERDSLLYSAVQAARDACDATRVSTREQRALYAIQALYECQQILEADSNSALAANPGLAQHYFTRAIYAAVTRIRCYLEIDELALASSRLVEEVESFDAIGRLLVARWLGKHPAVFFHPEVNDADCQRFVRIVEWLERKSITEVIIEKMRADFWNQEIVKNQPEDLFTRLRGEKPVRFSETLKALSFALSNAEAVIENLQRLQGYELELRSARLMVSGFNDWSNIVDPTDAITYLLTDQPVEVLNNQHGLF